MMHNFMAKPGTQKMIVNVYSPAVVLAADTDTAAGVGLGIGAAAIAFGNIIKTSYFREGASADVLVAETLGVIGTWSSGGWLLIDATNMKGWYQYGIPNACLVNGAKWVDIGIEIPDDKGTSVQIHIDLVRSLAW